MAKGTNKDVKIEMLERQLRRLEPTGSIDITPSPSLSQLAFIHDTDDPAQANL